MRVGFAQLNPTVGDLRGNFEKILQSYERLAAAGAELIVTPELAITGYPPQDLVFKSRFVPETLEILDELHRRVGKAALPVGFVDRNEGRGRPFHNAAALLVRDQPIRKAHKSLLPTYDVFDEDRYFQPAENSGPRQKHRRSAGAICALCGSADRERAAPPHCEMAGRGLRFDRQSQPARRLFRRGDEVRPKSR